MKGASPQASRAVPHALRSLVIVAAMDDELRPLLARTSALARTTPAGGCRMWRGRLAGIEVLLARTGIGRSAAARGAAAALERGRSDLLVVVGVSGALSPGLAPCAVFAASRLVDGRTAGPLPDQDHLASLLALEGVGRATYVTSPLILHEPAAKAGLGASVAGGSAALVDLETAGYANAARAAGVPWIGLRAVSDPAEEALPLDFESLRDARGGLSRARVAARALVRPSSLLALVRLRSRVRTGAERTAELLVHWLEEHAGA